MSKPNNVPELQRLLRTAGWLWLGYLAALMLIDWIIYQAFQHMEFYYIVNGLAALVFLGLAYWGVLERWLKKAYLPLALAWIVGLPLVMNSLMLSGFQSGPMFSPEGMALRQLPVLFVALVITAWQYGLAGVIVFSGFTVLLELFLVIFVSPLIVFVSVAPPPSAPHEFSPTSFRSVDMFIVLA